MSVGREGVGMGFRLRRHLHNYQYEIIWAGWISVSILNPHPWIPAWGPE